jgi:hypothetical protein
MLVLVMGGIFNCAVQMDSGAMIYVLSFAEMGSVI